MSAIATGSYTIVDYNDAPLLSGWISVQGSKSQGFNPDTNTYVPNFEVNPLKLTASLFVSGTSDDLLEGSMISINNIQWYAVDSKGTKEIIPGANEKSYSVRKNLVNDVGITYIFECTYTQPASGLSVPVSLNVEINKVINGTGIADAVIVAPNGNVFKNENFDTLEVECQLWSGSILDPDVDATSYKWWKMDPNGKGGEHNIGVGWRNLDNTNDISKGYRIVYRNSTSILTIPKGDVASSAVYMCTVYCDAKGHEEVFKETISVLDTTDPIHVSFDSTGGYVFKNGIGSTILTAKLFQNGQEIDHYVEPSMGEQKYTYKWYKYDRNGDMVDKNGNFSDGTTPYHIGKVINVTSDDVYEKATFRCDIS